jgi:hypothetical protein
MAVDASTRPSNCRSQAGPALVDAPLDLDRAVVNVGRAAPPANGTRTLHAPQVAANWNESTVTWANQPATTGSPATTASGVGWREWTVTTQVASMYTGGNYGFLIRDAAENGGGAEQGFHSREKVPDNTPQLVITFD